VFFDTIITCSVTGSTQAGMIAGFAAQQRPRRVIGIDASFRLEETRDAVERIARATAEKIGLPREITAEDVEVVDGYAHPRYGIPNEETIAAIRLSGRLEGMIVDPVYEGKSLHGMTDLIRRGDIPPDSNVLYVHLGGAPALNGYSALFRR
jgi:1-aminocyclopropane-1-carboxylate deaminase